MLNWGRFSRSAPAIAAVGKALMYHPSEGRVVILATVDDQHRPWVAPVCPIFTGDGLYLLAAANTPKARHLQTSACYALHAMVGADDCEFQLRGEVRTVDSTAERDQVIAAITFDSFDADDPIFEFLVDHALAVTWPQPGKASKTSWSAGR